MSGELPDDLFAPRRTRPEVEWSVALSQAGASMERWVRYGLSEEAICAFVRARGGDPEALFPMLEAAYGAPVQLACGQDGERAKLYWFLRGDDPHFVGVDLVEGRPPALKWYRGLEPRDGATALEALPLSLQEPLQWLLERLEGASAPLFHLVLLSREVPPRYTGVHVGLAPDWAGLLEREPGLLRIDVAQALCERLGLEVALEGARRRLFGPPMAWTPYLSLLVRPDGRPGANIYTRASPVCEVDGALALVEPGRGGVVPRPVVVAFGLRRWPELTVRVRTWGDGLHFLRLGAWQVDYHVAGSPGGPDLHQDCLDLIEGTARSAVDGLGPLEPVEVARRLRHRAEVSDVHLGPDMRFGSAGAFPT